MPTTVAASARDEMDWVKDMLPDFRSACDADISMMMLSSRIEFVSFVFIRLRGSGMECSCIPRRCFHRQLEKCMERLEFFKFNCL